MKTILTVISCLVFCVIQSYAAVPMDKLSAQKQCEVNWQINHQNHNKHIGKMICDCTANDLMPFQKDHAGDKDLDHKIAIFLKQPSHFCVTEGILANTVSRANFFFITDQPSIEEICDSSWVGVMRAFNPNVPKFDSKKICSCASPELTQIIAQSDTLSPANIRTRLANSVKTCDLTNTTEFTSVAFSENKVTNHGVFDLEIKKDPDPDTNNIANYLREKGELKKTVGLMSQTISIPYNIHVVTESTNAGSYYTHKDKTIHLDYQLMEVVLALYDKYYPKQSEENRHHYLNNLNRFLLYHELGHALIDAYHLPVLGQEEDAADALGAVIALNYVKRGYHTLLDSADFFSLLEEAAPTMENSYWDEHALNKQRYYRLLCFAYGHSPAEVQTKLTKYYKNKLNGFIKDRSDYCIAEYSTTYESWMNFLKPYLKIPPTQVENQ